METQRNEGQQPIESSELPTEFKGVLEFYFETGTEGGFWAFQDERFIAKTPSNYAVWGNQEVFDTTNPDRKGKTQDNAEVLHGLEWEPLPDPISREDDYFSSSLFKGEENGDRDADKRLMEKYDFKIKYSADEMNEMFGEGNWHLEEEGFAAVGPDGIRYFYGGTPNTEPMRPYGTTSTDITRVTVDWSDGTTEQRLSDSLLVESWSYDGLHYLNNGDRLTIFDKDNPEIIIWQGEINLSDFTVFQEGSNGMWIHNRQIGEDVDKWGEWFMTKFPAKLELGNGSIEMQENAAEQKAKLKA